MTKKMNKILFIFTIAIIMMSILNISNGTSINTANYKVTASGDIGGFGTMAGIIVWILQFVGYSVAVIMLAVMGIKYMLSSSSEKADIKSRLIPYTIGAVLLFASATFLNIIYNIVSSA